MQRLIGFVLEKFGELGPVRRLFKFFFGRVFDNLIDREIRLSDFKNHILELDNLPLSATKINKVYLSDSPYRLESGVIGRLRIKLASFRELTTKDIEVSLERIHLKLKFNQNYHKQKNFSPNEQSSQPLQPEVQDIDLPDDEVDDEGQQNIKQDQSSSKGESKDMFKCFIRQVLSNIKLSINDLVIDVLMNEPSTSPTKEHAYLMLRLKRLKVYQQKKEVIHKKLKVLKSKSENLYWIKLKEISAFIIKPNKEDKQNQCFPWSVPSISNAQCIFTCSFQMKQIKENISSQKNDQQNLFESCLFDFNHSMVQKDLKNENLDDEAFLPHHLQIECLFNPNDGVVKGLKIYIPPVEVQLDPLQLKIISNYFEQFTSYSRMRKTSEFRRNHFSQRELRARIISSNPSREKSHKERFGVFHARQMQQENDNNKFLLNDHFTLDSANENSNIFEAEDCSLNKQNSQSNPPSPKNFSQSINSESNDINNAIYDFSNEISFDFYSTQFDFKLFALNAYLLKHTPLTSSINECPLYTRDWIYYFHESEMSEGDIYIEHTSFNCGIPSNYFMFSLKSLKLSTLSKSKKSLTLSSFRLLDVNLIEHRGILPSTPSSPVSSPLTKQMRQATERSFQTDFFQSCLNPSEFQTQPQQQQQLNIEQSQQSVHQNKYTVDQNSSTDLFQSCLNSSQFQLQKSSIQSSQHGQQQQQLGRQSVNQLGGGSDDDLFMSIENSQFIPQINSRQPSQLEKIDEDAELKIITNNCIQDISKRWRINQSSKHFCINDLLRIKPRPPREKLNVLLKNGSSQISFKQDILSSSIWKPQNSALNSTSDSSFAISADLVKNGCELTARVVMSEVYASADLKVLKDFYQIMYPIQDWMEFNRRYLATDLKLLQADNITLLELYAKKSEQIEAYYNNTTCLSTNKATPPILNSNASNNEFSNKTKTSTNADNCESLSFQFSLEIVNFKGVFFNYNENSDLKKWIQKMEYMHNNTSGSQYEFSQMCEQTCFCSHLQSTSNQQKKYLPHNMAFQCSNIAVQCDFSPSQLSSIQVSLGQTLIGMLTISKTLSLNSTHSIFKLYWIAKLDLLSLSFKTLTQAQSIALKSPHQHFLSLKLETMQFNVWNTHKLLSFAKNFTELFTKYQVLLAALQKLERDSEKLQNISLLERDKISEEVRSIDGSDQEREDEEEEEEEEEKDSGSPLNGLFIKSDIEETSFLSESDISVEVCKLEVRVIYEQKYRQYREEKRLITFDHLLLSQKAQYSLSNYLQERHQQTSDKNCYSPLESHELPLDLSMELTVMHSFFRVRNGTSFTVKLYEIYLLDYQQTKIELGNYGKQSKADHTYQHQSTLAPNTHVLDYQVLIYSACSFDQATCQTIWNSKLNSLICKTKNKTSNLVIDIDEPFESVSNQSNSVHPPEYCMPTICLKASYQRSKQQFISPAPLHPSYINTQNNPSILNTPKSEVSSEDSFLSEEECKHEESSKIKVKIKSLSLNDLKVRFGDFRGEMIQNVADIFKILSGEEVNYSNQSNVIKKCALSDVNKEIEPLSKDSFELEVMEVKLNDIVIDLFPFHDYDIRERLPRAFPLISSENMQKAFYSNQRSLIQLKNTILTELFYNSLTQDMTFSLNVQGLDLFSLVFEDFKQHLNPLLICRRQRILWNSNIPNARETRNHHSFIDQIEALGFQSLVEISFKVSLKNNPTKQNISLHMNRCYVSACKDSIQALPLHLTLLSLLFQRLTSSPKGSLPNQNLSDSHRFQNTKSFNTYDRQLFNEDEPMIIQSTKQNGNLSIKSTLPSSSPQKKKSDDFEDIDEKFIIEMEESEKEAERDKNQFLKDAKDQSLEYFHKQKTKEGEQADVNFEFKIKEFEIQIFCGKDFDFDETPKSISLAQRRKRNTRNYKQNLLLAFDQIQFLYSSYPSRKKIDLSIQKIYLQGSSDSQSLTLLRKKERDSQMFVTDVFIDEERKQVFVKLFMGGIVLLIDKTHKSLFEDLSNFSLDLDRVALKRSTEKDSSFFNESIMRSQIINHDDDQEEEDDNEAEEEEDDDDEYEICEGNEPDGIQALGYKIGSIYVNALEIEITVNWYVNSLLKESILSFSEFFASNPQGMMIDASLISKLQGHYTKIFDVHLMKNNQLFKILKDVVLIRNITNLTKGLANLFILPYKAFRNNGKISQGILEGVKGLQQSVFMETQNFFSLASNIYQFCIRKNFNGLKKIKKLLKKKRKL